MPAAGSCTTKMPVRTMMIPRKLTELRWIGKFSLKNSKLGLFAIALVSKGPT
jgi:hypothetical protein